MIEGLDLAGVEPGEYELICLPIKVHLSAGDPEEDKVMAVGTDGHR